mgnify:CR=1 FL=1
MPTARVAKKSPSAKPKPLTIQDYLQKILTSRVFKGGIGPNAEQPS